MQTRAITRTLLEAQDLRLLADYRETPAIRRPEPERMRPGPHDFLVLSARPDLTPEFLPAPGAHR